MMMHKDDGSILITSEKYDLSVEVRRNEFIPNEWKIHGILGNVWIHTNRTPFSTEDFAILASHSWLSTMELAISTAHLTRI